MLLLTEEKGVGIPCSCRPSYFISSLSWHNLSVQEGTCPPPASALFSPHQDGRAPFGSGKRAHQSVRTLHGKVTVW